jgi:phosphatidylinositol-3-phosphatase
MKRVDIIALSLAAMIMSSSTAVKADDGERGQNGVPRLDHVFVIMLENHNLTQIIGNSKAPYINYLGNEYNLATNYSAVWHPSLPNYLATIAGDYFGVSDDNASTISVPPGPWSFPFQTIGSQLEVIGKDWRDYQEDIPEAGSVAANWPRDTDTGNVYAVKHNPFPYFVPHQSPGELAKMVPLTQLFSDLANETSPALSYIVPNQCGDMHNLGNSLSPCANYTDDQIVARVDREIEWLVTSITGSRTWYNGKNVIFVVFDEGNDTPLQDKVVAIAITSYGSRGIRTNYTHYSLLKTIEAAFGLPYLRHAGDSNTKAMTRLLSR